MPATKKLLVPAFIIGGALALGVALYGASQGWFSRKPQDESEQTTGPVTPKSKDEPEEPKYVSPEVKAPELLAFVNRTAEMRERIPPDITSKIPRVRHDEDLDVVISILEDTRDNDTVRNEAVNLLRRSGYKELTDRLIKILDSPREGPRFRSFCIQHLWLNLEKAGNGEKARITAALHKALGDKHVPVRRQALLALVRERDPKGQELALTWLVSPEGAEVRDLAIRCVKELDLKEHISIIRKYLRDPSEPTKIAAIVALSQWGDEQSRPAFEEAAKSKSVRLQRAGRAALKRLDKAKEETQG